MSSSLLIRSDLSTGQIVQGTVASLAFVVSAHYILARRRARAKENDKPTRTGATVYGFAMANPCEGDRSPFCTKIMTFLKMTQTEYEYVPFHDHQGKGSPKGKMPWIQFPEVLGDESMGDSTMIIKALVKADPDKYDLDVHLSDSEKAIGWAMKTMVEESLYFSAVLYPRWATDEFYTLTLPEYFGRESWIVQKAIKYLVRPKVVKILKGQGTGLLTDDEIAQKAQTELQALSNFLGTKKYFMGDRVSSIDATMYSFLVGGINSKWTHPACQAVKDHQNLLEYTERMRAEFWGSSGK